MQRSRRSTDLAVALAFVALAGSGCVSAPVPEQWKSDLEKKLVLLEKHDAYEDHWLAAMDCAELADESSEHRPRNEREEFAKRGMEHGERATRLQPDSAEGHFYRALCIGRYLEAERLPTFSLVTVLRDEGERAAELDHLLECSGAHRLLGELYGTAPEWGPGGVGDKEKAEKNFLLALHYTPACPENHLAYAKFLMSMDRTDTARAEAEKARGLIDAHTCLHEIEKQHLRERCDELLKELDQK
jgi:hypothetical protein